MIGNEALPSYPEKEPGEFGYQVARATVGVAELVAPFAGTGLQALLDRFVGSPLEERRAAWFNLVGAKLQSVLEHEPTLQRLKTGEFTDTIVDATLVAMKSRHDEKREALANAVANTALGMTLDEVLRGAFIAYVDQFAPMHLSVLRVLGAPQLDMKFADKAVHLLQQSQEGILGGPRVFSDEDVTLVRVLMDLDRAGLVSSSLNQSAATPEAALKRTTKVGEAFLRFVGPPAA